MIAYMPFVLFGLVILGLVVVMLIRHFGEKADPGHKGDARKTAEEEELHRHLKDKKS